MRLLLLFLLLSGMLFATPALALNVSLTNFPSSPFTDTTYTTVKNVSEPPKSKKVGIFKKIRNAVVGFVVKMQLAKENKKSSPLIFALASIGLLITGLALLFSSGGGGHASMGSGLLGLGFILLALIFAVAYVVKRRSQKKAKKE